MGHEPETIHNHSWRASLLWLLEGSQGPWGSPAVVVDSFWFPRWVPRDPKGPMGALSVLLHTISKEDLLGPPPQEEEEVLLILGSI